MRRAHLSAAAQRRPTVALLLGLALAFCLVVLSIQSSFFAAPGAPGRRLDLDADDVRELAGFQSRVQQCVASRGLGLTTHIIDHCKLVLKFPEGTNSTRYNAQFKFFEPLEYKYDVCETILLWEHYRNMTTVLTREYLDVRPDGWLDYAAKRIAQLGADKCYNRTLCDELLSILLPAKPPFHPRQFATCAVVAIRVNTRCACNILKQSGDVKMYSRDSASLAYGVGLIAYGEDCKQKLKAPDLELHLRKGRRTRTAKA
ncbi:Sialyltransferase-like protein 1 [Zea mays]|uniref:Sialyltransferase-like protein 1 n=1 Tax=Zea mays TaxID=4577 RepID=A0A1D6HL23_MAIZE|nr:Sialyltransferase-like protein 1 [Zea mays]